MEAPIPDRLQEILSWKRIEIEEAKAQIPLGDLTKRALEVARLRKDRPFRKALTKEEGSIKIIAEIKRASPSKGVIKDHLDVTLQAKTYESAGASAVSVLTERKFFQGTLGDLLNVKKSINVPVLRKDFILEPYQLYESVIFGADAVLLIARILSKAELGDLLALSDELGLDALIETHDETDMEKALQSGASIVGINNRDLSSFKVSLETTLRLSQFLDPKHHIGVSESGIQSRKDIEWIVSKTGIRSFLVGELLMKSNDPAREIRSLKGNQL
ncbi:MAG: indole-3-glycerol phosphate synthase TrpC [Syntrophobacterales bacterium]|nr:indole-3-glycerol phosphate synthase TrpC [Syntrophobacterales bacterium]